MVPMRIEERWHRQGRWVWTIIAGALVLSGCSGNVSQTASTTTTAASAPLSSAVVPEAPRAPADVTAADLLTAEVPAYCDAPAQRLVEGRAVQFEQGEGALRTTAIAPLFHDFAGLGYQQALSVYECNAGGVGWPAVLLVTGAGGELLGHVLLGEVGAQEHASVQELTRSGDQVLVTWSSYDGAGFKVRQLRSLLGFSGGQVQLTADPDDVHLGVPGSQIYLIDNPVGVGFSSPSGRLSCGFFDNLGEFAAICQGGARDEAIDERCDGQIMPIVDSAGGWVCAGGVMVDPVVSAQSQWWTTGDPSQSLYGMGEWAVLDYGRGLRFGDLLCVIQPSGATCANVASGASFTTSVEATSFDGPFLERPIREG